MRRRFRYAFVFMMIPALCCYWALRLPWWGAAPLAWIGVSFLPIGLAFVLAEPRLLCKRKDGRLNPLIYLVTLPYLTINAVLLYLVMRYSHEHPADVITEDIVLGRHLFPGEDTTVILMQGVAATIDLTAEFNEPRGLRMIPYLLIPTLDTFQPSLDQLHEAVGFIEAHRTGGPIYIHCAMGHGRSAMVVAAWLIRSEQLEIEEAIDFIKTKRPRIGLHEEQRALLTRYKQAIDNNGTA